MQGRQNALARGVKVVLNDLRMSIQRGDVVENPVFHEFPDWYQAEEYCRANPDVLFAYIDLQKLTIGCLQFCSTHREFERRDEGKLEYEYLKLV